MTTSNLSSLSLEFVQHILNSQSGICSIVNADGEIIIVSNAWQAYYEKKMVQTKKYSRSWSKLL